MEKKSIILIAISLLFLFGIIFYKTTSCQKMIVADKKELTITDYRIYFSRGDSYLWSMEVDGSDIEKIKSPKRIGSSWLGMVAI